MITYKCSVCVETQRMTLNHKSVFFFSFISYKLCRIGEMGDVRNGIMLKQNSEREMHGCCWRTIKISLKLNAADNWCIIVYEM